MATFWLDSNKHGQPHARARLHPLELISAAQMNQTRLGNISVFPSVPSFFLTEHNPHLPLRRYTGLYNGSWKTIYGYLYCWMFTLYSALILWAASFVVELYSLSLRSWPTYLCYSDNETTNLKKMAKIKRRNALSNNVTLYLRLWSKKKTNKNC